MYMLPFFQDTLAEFHLLTVATKDRNSSNCSEKDFRQASFFQTRRITSHCEWNSESKIKGPDTAGQNVVTSMDVLTGPIILIIIVLVPRLSLRKLSVKFFFVTSDLDNCAICPLFSLQDRGPLVGIEFI